MEYIAQRRKVVVMIVGLAVIMANQALGIDFSGVETEAVNLIVGVLTIFAAERIPNKPIETSDPMETIQ
ncbi:MAG: hypothetical protein NXI13_16465 [Proteobacteria bacterium]|nr:hypothetical protein [Pseudomonadota bacterium]